MKVDDSGEFVNFVVACCCLDGWIDVLKRLVQELLSQVQKCTVVTHKSAVFRLLLTQPWRVWRAASPVQSELPFAIWTSVRGELHVWTGQPAVESIPQD